MIAPTSDDALCVMLLILERIKHKVETEGNSHGICGLIDQQWIELQWYSIGVDNAVVDLVRNTLYYKDISNPLASLMLEWPEHSGDVSYPVSAPLRFKLGAIFVVRGTQSWFQMIRRMLFDPQYTMAKLAYFESHSWEGEYGKYRMRLLDWMIGVVNNRCVERGL